MARNTKNYSQHHSSLSAFVAWIDATPATWTGQKESKTARASTDWDLRLGYEGALKLAREGWADGATRMANAIATLPALESVSRVGYSVAGGSPSIGRYCSGNPLHMRTRKREHGHKPAITLAVNVVANQSGRAECMSNYGLAIARYTDQLELAGYPVEVVAVCMSQQSGRRVAHSWTVKEQGHAMNLADMAYSIGHPGCFRRLGFAAFERSPVPECWGYGCAVQIESGDLPSQYRDAILLNGIGSANYHSATPDSALEALRETIDAALEQREAQYH
jgi:hypothetical protein